MDTDENWFFQKYKSRLKYYSDNIIFNAQRININLICFIILMFNVCHFVSIIIHNLKHLNSEIIDLINILEEYLRFSNYI